MKKILIVEDNNLNLQLFNDLLTAHGYNAILSRDGRDVTAIAQQEHPNLIIMDIQLPYVSGVDIIRELKSNPKTSFIPIVAVTAFAMKEDEERIRNAGCEDYMAKPITIDSFMTMVERYCK